MQTKSIFNPEITITDDKWAVTYAMHNHNTDEREHAFLAIQSPTTLFKKELYYNADKPGFARVEEDERVIVSADKLNQQVNLLLWKSSNPKFTMKDLSHKTWLVDQKQVQEMFTDIQADCTNPPRFSIYGVASILKKDEYQERKLTAGFMMSGIGVVYCLGVAMGDPVPLAVAAMNMAAVGGSTMLSENGLMQAFDYKDRYKAHNCGTWCVEKLTNLNIPTINKDLGTHFTDKFAYVTGLHLGKDDVEKYFGAGVLLGGAGINPDKCRNSVKPTHAEQVAKTEEDKGAAK